MGRSIVVRVGTYPAHEFIVPLQEPSRLSSPVTNGPPLPSVGSAHVNPWYVVSQKIESWKRSCPTRTLGARPTLKESVGDATSSGEGPWFAVL